MDVQEDMLIGFQKADYGIGIIEPTVFAVGQNDKFIIIKQHPKLSTGVIDKSTINYFIISLKNKVDTSTEKNIYGPLSLEEFERTRRELRIEDLDFMIFLKI